MFENILSFFKKKGKSQPDVGKSKDAAKERLHLVLMQDRANVSADFLDLMKQEIIEVIKKYIEVDENAIDVRLTNKANADGTNGAPALYANIPIMSIKEEAKNGVEKPKETVKLEEKQEEKKEETNPDKKEEEGNKVVQSQQESQQEEIVKQEEKEEHKPVEQPKSN